MPVLTLAILILAMPEMLPHYDIRELVIESSLVVIADPDDLSQHDRAGVKTGRFHVTEILRGEGIKTGDIITVDLDGYFLNNSFGFDVDEKHEITRVILFLGDRHDKKNEAYIPILSGLRYLTKQGKILSPYQYSNPGDYSMREEKEMTWDRVETTVREEVKNVDAVMAIKAIGSGARRNRALFAWIDKHRNEFFDFKKDIDGWGRLETDVFHWIMESRMIGDCWRAVRLRADIKPDWARDWDEDGPVFASPEGRALLLNVILDDKYSFRDRSLAACNLGTYHTLWHRENAIGVDDQNRLIENLLPLLTTKDDNFRLWIIRTLRDASDPPGGDQQQRKSRAALPELMKRYPQEPPGIIRDTLADTIARLCSEREWLDLTGNSRHMVVQLNGPYKVRDRIHFSITVDPPSKGKIFQQPILMMERKDDHMQIAEKREIVLTGNPPKEWKEGWGCADGEIRFDIAADSLSPGLWWFRVKGNVDEISDGSAWVSEPKSLIIPRMK